MGRQKRKRYPLVHVTWIDSTFYKATSAWLSPKESRKWARGQLPSCQSAGFLVHEDDHGLTIALSINQNGWVADFIKIPCECIRDVVRLRPVS